MNVIILSRETGGGSMVGAIISQMHYAFTREKIFWNYEISRLMAIDPDYNFPKGFCLVYYVNPLDLLKRVYDKIIILKRDIESIKQDICDRNGIDINSKKYPKFFEKSIPIAIGTLIVIMIGMLIFAILVILGLFSGV